MSARSSCRFVPQSEDELVEILDKATTSGLLVDQTNSAAVERYSFREEHVRDVLYESIPATRRRRYHLRAGRGLEASQPQPLEELAYHFTNGNDASLGASYSFRAAERASAAFSWNRAIASARRRYPSYSRHPS